MQSLDSPAQRLDRAKDPEQRGKPRYYYENIGDLRQRLKAAVSQDELKRLHRIQPWRHFLLVARHTSVFLACAWVLYAFPQPWIWIPVAILQGFNLLGFVILLHDQVHKLIFRRRHPTLRRLLGLYYALPSAISATQFDIWHNDHHRELGSDTTDPKRAHLSPKRVKRWYKLLYFTPGLFVIYAIAAAREAKGYPVEIRRRIRNERIGNAVIHLGVAVALGWLGWDVLLRVYAVPLFLCFPPAFFLNRMGQHYDVNPEDVASWSTLVNGNPVWRFLFLNSNHHIEHHYYPSVPLYNLPRLNRILQPFFAEVGIPNRSYTHLLWGWLVRNKTPHTNWETDLA